MGKTILDIKILYPSLGAAEKRVADFLMADPSRVLPLSITELAEQSGGSEATIVRLAKRLGFSGYQQLKISIAQEENVGGITENIEANDSVAEIFAKVCNDVYCSLEKTRRTLDADQLERCCESLLAAREILIFGLGNSASVATDFAHKLLRLGLKATAYTDNHMQAIAAAHTDAASFVVGISHSGSSRDIVQALQLARGNGAVTAAITGAGKSPVTKTCDYVLHTVADEVNYNILGLTSRIAQLAIIDTMYSYVACHLPDAKAAIRRTEQALLGKKF